MTKTAESLETALKEIEIFAGIRVSETEPEQKKEAERELCRIYEKSPYYSARYASGKALNLNLDGEVMGWALKLGAEINDLRSRKSGGRKYRKEASIKISDAYKLYELSKSRETKSLLEDIQGG